MAAFERTRVRPDGKYATAIGDSVRVDASPGAMKSIAWLLAQATEDEVAEFLPRSDDRLDEGAIWALSARTASESIHHPNARSRPYPDVVWSDAVARALRLPPALWRRMETEAKVAEPT